MHSSKKSCISRPLITTEGIQPQFEKVKAIHEMKPPKIINIQTEASNLIGHIQYRNKRSLLPLGGLFGFLFGTADQADLDALKVGVKQLYQNQMDQTNVLNDIITITNVSRGLINENIKK